MKNPDMKNFFSYIIAGLLVLLAVSCSNDDDLPTPEASIVSAFTFAITGDGFAPDTVQFTSTSIVPEGKSVTYLWDFGDGTFSDAANPQHIYEMPGLYNVRLVLTGETEIVRSARSVTLRDPSAVGVNLYFANVDGNIYNALINDQAPSYPVLAEDQGAVDALAVDTVANIVYAGKANGDILRFGYDGAALGAFKTGQEPVAGLAVDYDLGRLYWSGDEGIFYSSLDSEDQAAAETLVTGITEDPRGLAVDPATGTVFINTYDGGIYTTGSDGSGLTELLPDILGVAIAVVEGQLVYHTFDLGTSAHALRIANLDGTNIRTVDTGMDGDIFGIGYDAVNSMIYWNDRRNSTIRRANANGTGAEDFIEDPNLGDIFPVAVGEFGG